MKSILGLGNALVDILTTIPNDILLQKYNLPRGSMQHVDEQTSNSILNDLMELGCERIAGGSVANTINGIARLNMNAGFIGKIGDDKFGSFFEEDQRSSGINPKLLIGKSSTGRALVLISNDAERTFATYLGAAIEMEPLDLDEALFDNYHFFHIEGYLVQNHSLVRQAVQIACNKGMMISLDMASYNVVEANHSFLEEILKTYVDIVFANEDEARAFTGKEPEQAVSELAKICRIAVVKIGEKGSLVQSGNTLHRIDPIEAVATDATGAGDLYASGFLYGLAHDLPLDKCGAIGSLCAGKVVEVIGPKMDNECWEGILTGIKNIVE
ncbi:MAG: adenosine kinase [Prevotellaceae bacterium]|jgi:sugar/nucleoside kinase (ribokinase family)|nr:adenosine kinase [Prevotellaceae bacterium]